MNIRDVVFLLPHRTHRRFFLGGGRARDDGGQGAKMRDIGIKIGSSPGLGHIGRNWSNCRAWQRNGGRVRTSSASRAMLPATCTIVVAVWVDRLAGVRYRETASRRQSTDPA